ncbi:LysR family transcriptional regulator [Vibrio gallicus]|uniref:LysR family transcriptional regulator n=1 Tax=Vibrio gallicus TaxID=190897 RepID=UPI0021C29EFF|nr:LysR family transcriptional regulator [Vibrio gallicus]
MIHERAGQMVVFHTLVLAGSFTNAAKRLGVSTSYVSKQLSLLEKELNIQLLQRTTRSLALTQAGQHYFDYAEQVVQAVNEASSAIETDRNDVTGTIKIGLAQSFGTMHILPAINELRALFPELQVELSLFDHKADMLAEGLDLWITNYEVLPEGYVAQRLAESKFIVVASPDYLTHYQAPTHPEQLASHNCLIYRSLQRDYSRWSFAKNGESLTVGVSGNYKVDLAEAVRDAALSGWGVAYLASYLLTDEFKSGKLIQLLPDWKANQSMPFYAVYPKRKHLPTKISAVIEFFKQRIGRPTYWDQALRPQVKF